MCNGRAEWIGRRCGEEGDESANGWGKCAKGASRGEYIFEARVYTKGHYITFFEGSESRQPEVTNEEYQQHGQ